MLPHGRGTCKFASPCITHANVSTFRSSLTLILWLLCAGTAAAASLLPLTIEEARTLPSGTAEAILGVSYFDGLRFPMFTQPGQVGDQTLLQAPQLSFRIGAGDWAEIQASYELLRLEETGPGAGSSSTYGSGDARLFTKVRILHERRWRPAFGLRFGTKLPDANARDRLGTDETDFLADTLFSKDLGPLELNVNLGLYLIGNPGTHLPGNTSTAGGQDDLFSYKLGAASAPLGATGSFAGHLRVMAELAGLTGSRYSNERTSVRGGLQYRRGALAFYAGASAGLQSGSENYGLLGGVIWTFEPGKLLGLQEAPEPSAESR